jgi:hypothetical protein
MPSTQARWISSPDRVNLAALAYAPQPRSPLTCENDRPKLH